MIKNAHYPSLMIVLDSRTAKWFIVERDGIMEIDELRDTYERYTDKNGLYKSRIPHSHAVKAGAPEVENPRRREHIATHLRSIADKTAQLWKANGDYRHMCFALPEIYRHIMADEVKRVLPSIQVEAIHGLYMNHSLAQLHALFREHLLVPAVR